MRPKSCTAAATVSLAQLAIYLITKYLLNMHYGRLMSRPISQAAILARGSEMRHKFCNLLDAAAAVAPANNSNNRRSHFAYLSRNAKPAITQPQSPSPSQPQPQPLPKIR